MCDSNKNGVVEITEKTLENTYALARALMKKYNIDINHVYRHYDVNGKLCPNCNGLLDDAIWNNFKNNIVNATVGNLGTSTSVPKPAVNPNKDSLISRGQQHSINFTGHAIATDGAFGPKTQANVARCFQHAMPIKPATPANSARIFPLTASLEQIFPPKAPSSPGRGC